MSERLCRHEPCACEPKPGEAYCAPVCADLDGESAKTNGRCPCGHPQCRPANVPEEQPPPEAQPPGSGDT